MKIELASWGVATGLTVIISLLVVRSACGIINMPGVLVGWGVSLANALIAFVINRRSIGKSPREFLALVIFGIAIRALTVLGSVYIVYAMGFREIFPEFAIALLVGLFIYMVRENFSLYRFRGFSSDSSDSVENKAE
jgi:hypothetical protein